MTSVLLIATFFASIFELNAVCLHYIEASKERVSALQAVHDRIETLRNLAFTDLTSESYLTTLLTTPANGSSIASKVTEVVTVSDYSTGLPSITLTRTPGATVIPSVVWNSLGALSFPSTTTLVKANVSYSWNMTFTGRPRTEQTETIISDGVKK